MKKTDKTPPTKPRIKQGKVLCSCSALGILSYGKTPSDAYANWLLRLDYEFKKLKHDHDDLSLRYSTQDRMNAANVKTICVAYQAQIDKLEKKILDLEKAAK